MILLCLKNINWSDPTIISGIIGGLMGIIGSLLGVILGVVLNQIGQNKKKIITFSDVAFDFKDDDIKTNNKLVSNISFKMFISNTSNQNYSLSFLNLVIKEKSQNDIILQLSEQDNYKKEGGLVSHFNANNYVIAPNSSVVLSLMTQNALNPVEINKKSRMYLQFKNANGKNIYKKIKYSLSGDYAVKGA